MRLLPRFRHSFPPLPTGFCRQGNFVTPQADNRSHHPADANLEVAPDKIDPDAPLYGEGLGLDSIDILEVALVVAKRYNLQLKAESDENHVIFASLRNLAQYVAAHATSVGAPQV